MNTNIAKIEHVAKAPLSIERDMQSGYEKIIIEGVVYDAEYFRTFAHPDTDVLYAVRNDSDDVVCLTIIQTVDEAVEFFNEVGDCFAAENKGAARNDIAMEEENVI